MSDQHAKSAEQQARELLDRLGMEDAPSLTSGDVVELANLIAERNGLERELYACSVAFNAELDRVRLACQALAQELRREHDNWKYQVPDHDDLVRWAARLEAL